MTILFNGDWSTGDVSQYQNYQTQSGGGAIFNSPSLDPLIPAPTVISPGVCLFSLPAAACDRSELIPALTAGEGTEWWIGWWTKLGATVNTSTGRGFQTVGQFHQGPNPGTGRWMPSPPVATSIQSVDPPIWVIHNGDTEALYTQDVKPGPLVEKGNWTQMIYHIIFSYDPAVGTVDWWVNGTQYADTWHPANGTLYSDGAISAKIGFHRADPQPAADVMVSGYRIGSTRPDVDSGSPVSVAVLGPTPKTRIQVGV